MRNAQTKWSNWQNVLLLRRMYEGKGSLMSISVAKMQMTSTFQKKKKIFIHAMQLRLSSSLHCQVKVGKNLKYETMRHFTHDSCIRSVVVIYSDSRKFRVDVGEKRSKITLFVIANHMLYYILRLGHGQNSWNQTKENIFHHYFWLLSPLR